MKRLFTLLLLAGASAQAQQNSALSVEKIMRDQKWIGVAPTNFRWAADSKVLFFDWNPENKDKSEGFQVQAASLKERNRMKS